MIRLYATVCARARCFECNLQMKHWTSFGEATYVSVKFATRLNVYSSYGNLQHDTRSGVVQYDDGFPVFFFSKITQVFKRCFDPVSIVLTLENKLCLGWNKRYLGWNKSLGMTRDTCLTVSTPLPVKSTAQHRKRHTKSCFISYGWATNSNRSPCFKRVDRFVAKLVL